MDQRSNTLHHFRGGLPWLVTIYLLTALAAQAQESTPREGGIEEIVVTAQRREQSLQDVPIAVTALSAEDLAAAQVSDLGGLQALVPNLSLTVGDSMNAVAFIRGVGQRENIAFADPGVGIYVDDVYLGRAQGAFLDVLDVERIEVLRGPQGTLYGRNTIGGAIKYVSAEPPDHLAGWAELTAGNFGRLDFKASLGGPLGQAVSGKFAVAKLTEDGYTHNLFSGDDIGDRDMTAWRGALRGQFSDALTLDFAVDGSRSRPKTARPPILMQPGAISQGEVLDDPYLTDVNFADVADLDTDGAVLTATWEASSKWTFKSISACRQMNWLFHFDVDATPLRSFDVFVDDEDQDQMSQELQFAYAGERLSAVGGLYYFREHDVTVQGVFSPDFAGGLGFYEIDRNDQLNRSYAAYTQLDFKLLPTLTLTAGLRYTREEKDFRRIQEFFGDVDFDGDVDIPAPTSVAALVAALGTGIRITDLDIPDGDPFDNTWSDVSPKLGVSWQAGDQTLLYATAAKGFKSGGFFGRANAAFDASPYDQEELWSYELGLKSTLLERRLRLNAAVFYNDYRDMQVTSFAASGGALVATFDNAGKSTLKGGELETTFVVSDALTLQANVAYLDAQFDEYIIAAPDGEPVDVASLRTLPFTPEWTARLGARYRMTLGSGDLALGVDLSYRGKSYFEINGSEALAQPAYELLDASLTYTASGGKWRVMLAGQNLTDKAYRDFGFDLSGSGLGQIAYYGKPRSYTVSVRYGF